MKSNLVLTCAALAIFTATAHSAAIISPGDPVVAFDAGMNPGASSYPGGENPSFALDSNSGTKYLNFGGSNSGIIVSPVGGPSTVQSFQLTTANDAEGRDPSSYELWGTNDPILSTDNSAGSAEFWTLISQGGLSLPSPRNTVGPVVDFANGASYSSYKMLFPTLKGDSLMQVADISVFTGTGGSGTNVFAPGSAALAIDGPTGQSGSPGGEVPAFAIDGNISSKHLNFGEVGSGLIVQPSYGVSVLTGIEVWTADDAEERDPTTFSIYGSNSPLTSTNHSAGTAESWTLIYSGSLALPAGRGLSGGIVPIPGMAAYSLYKFEVTGVKNEGDANSTQYAEIQLYGVPEPSGAALAGLGMVGLFLRRRRQK